MGKETTNGDIVFGFIGGIIFYFILFNYFIC